MTFDGWVNADCTHSYTRQKLDVSRLSWALFVAKLRSIHSLLCYAGHSLDWLKEGVHMLLGASRTEAENSCCMSHNL